MKINVANSEQLRKAIWYTELACNLRYCSIKGLEENIITTEKLEEFVDDLIIKMEKQGLIITEKQCK